MENTDYPLVSAIMLAGRTPINDVLATIKSFRNQTYPYKELVIINNSSSQYNASELNIHAQKDIFMVDTPIELTAGMARNYGIASANGQILAQFDSDYYHHPKRLEAQITALAKNDAEVCVLTETLAYSLINGRASKNSNLKSAILNSMVFIRPKDIDYPNQEKNEEKTILERLSKVGFKTISLSRPELMVKLYSSHYKRNYTVTNMESLNKSEAKSISLAISALRDQDLI